MTTFRALRVHETAGRMLITIVDDGSGLPGRGDLRDGVGLGTTRARLAGLYGDPASLTLAPAAGGRGTQVTIELPEGEVPRTDPDRR